MKVLYELEVLCQSTAIAVKDDHILPLVIAV